MKVLIFDDSPSAVLDIQLKVQSIFPNVEISRALTYEGAVDVIESKPIDIALVDLIMNGKNGVDFISEYLANHPIHSDLPVVIISAVGQNSLLRSALEGVVVEYLEKPVSTLRLKDVIDKGLQLKETAYE